MTSLCDESKCIKTEAQKVFILDCYVLSRRDMI